MPPSLRGITWRRTRPGIDLDLVCFRADLDDEVCRQRVREHQAGGRSSLLRATSTFLVDGAVQDISSGMRDLHGAIEAALAT